VSDLEYVQFHPTALCAPGESRFLLTEALRGEGAVLRDASGRAFARDYHPDGELAPRDVVARAVYEECRRGRERGGGGGGGGGAGGGHNAYLDATHRDPAWLVGRFPGVHAHLSSDSRIAPLDFTREMIPVTPAAHYTCGGVTTDLDGRVVSSSSSSSSPSSPSSSGRRHYRNLYAAGESARTGLHGGNRLASTSLLEGLVFGSSAGEAVAAASGAGGGPTSPAVERARRAVERRLATTIPSTNAGPPSSSSSRDGGAVAAEASAILSRLKSVMWEDVGVIRSRAGLERAVSELSAMLDVAEGLWEEAARGCSGGGGGGREAAALRDAARAGLAVADAALANRVSGGCHYVVPASSGGGEEDGARRGGGPTKEQDSDDDDDDGMVVARA
jgi:L-aspartate oxidase